MAGKNNSAFNEHTGLRLLTSPFRLIWHGTKIVTALLFFGPLLLILLTWLIHHPASTIDSLIQIKLAEAAYVGDGLTAYIGYAINTFVYWVYFKLTLIDAALFTDVQGDYLIKYRAFLLTYKDNLLAFLSASQVIATRLALICKTVPILIGIYVLALNFGLIARNIRKADAGRESSSLYHRYKYSQIWIFTIAIQLYLGMPVFVPVVAYFCVFYGLCGLLFSQQMMFYKKYL